MPTYDYKNLTCHDDKCEKIIEKFHGMNEKIEEMVCENCGQKIKVTKMLSGNAGVHFRGSGFFVNDYKRHDSSLNTYMPREEGSKKIF
jgi:predicted nucleic acid-binding Zn ribbon protein